MLGSSLHDFATTCSGQAMCGCTALVACLPGRCGLSSREYPNEYYRGLSLSTLSTCMLPLS